MKHKSDREGNFANCPHLFGTEVKTSAPQSICSFLEKLLEIEVQLPSNQQGTLIVKLIAEDIDKMAHIVDNLL